MALVSWEPTRACRACGNASLLPVFNFGDMPLADKLEQVPNHQSAAPRVPLSMVYCQNCSLSQLTASVSPAQLFDENYLYFSSVSPALQQHFAASAKNIIAMHGVGPGKLAIEAASNDGYMLRHFKAAGACVIGFDPAAAPANAALQAGIDTRMQFFGKEAAGDLVSAGDCADVFLANNVLAHIPDLTGFVAAMATVLKPDGIGVIEVPYLGDLVERGEFDTIYHQHLCYFNLTSLEMLLANAGLRLEAAERIDVHGGSLRLFVRHGSGTGETAKRLIEQEQANRWHQYEFACRIANAAVSTRNGLRRLLGELKAAGYTVRGYGAAAKAATLLAWCGLDSGDLGYVCDLNVRKHGWFMPGTNLEICAPDRIIAEQPDYVLILAWNFAEEIMQQLGGYRAAGGRFIVPIPDLRIV